MLKTPVLCPLKEANVPEVRFHVFDCLWWEGEGGQSRGTYVQTLQLHEGSTCITMATCMNRTNAVVSPLQVSFLYQKLNNYEIWYKMSPGHPSFVYSKQDSIGVGAGPAGPVLAEPLFWRFNKINCTPITAGPLQKLFLCPCNRKSLETSLQDS